MRPQSALMGFVCRTLSRSFCQAGLCLPYTKRLTDPIRLYLSRPLCAACQQGQQTDTPKPGERRIITAHRNSATQPDAIPWQLKRKRWRTLQGVNLSVQIRPVQSSSFSAMLSQQPDSAYLAAFQGAFPVIPLCYIASTLVFAPECL